jgi:hypothetical protein
MWICIAGHFCNYNIKIMEGTADLYRSGGRRGQQFVNPSDWSLVNSAVSKDPLSTRCIT